MPKPTKSRMDRRPPSSNLIVPRSPCFSLSWKTGERSEANVWAKLGGSARQGPSALQNGCLDPNCMDPWGEKKALAEGPDQSFGNPREEKGLLPEAGREGELQATTQPYRDPMPNQICGSSKVALPAHHTTAVDEKKQ